MRLEEKLREYGRAEEPPVREEKVRETVRAAKAALYQAEEGVPMSGLDFLVQQAGFIRKRWWLAQGVLLLLLWVFLMASGSTVYTRRMMGAMAPVFVLLLLPELWKNQSSHSMEIEGAAYFSIQKIYAARMVLFGMMDLLYLSLFFLASAFTLRLTVWEILVQFFLPMNVACCICFRSLCSNREDSGCRAFGMNLIWMGIWLFLILQEQVYELITVPVWAGCLAASVGYLFYSIRRVWSGCERFWEVNVL